MKGRTTEADVMWVNNNKTAVLKTPRGKSVKLPFDSFCEDDRQYLEYLLSRKRSGRGMPHSVTWQEMNRLFGLEIWQDDLLWDDATEAAATRIHLDQESKTAFMENFRAYPLGNHTVLDEPVYASALYGDHQHVTELSFIFLNLGDIDVSSNDLLGRHAGGSLLRRIADSGMRVHDTMCSILGTPARDALGKNDLREKVWRWDWDGHAIMLSMQEDKYAALRIMPTERADRGGRVDKLKSAELKQRMAACVERRGNGDVVIGNIPMINQGPKGYCSPATWERYLRYMNIPADMYLLAIAADTGVRGGTSYTEISEAVRSLLLANHRELEPLDDSLSTEHVADYIDRGLPVMWRFLSTPVFQQQANSNTARRNGGEFEEKDVPTGGIGGHICLIVGYNEQTGEIAISDSWGPEYTERWVPADQAQKVSFGSMNVITW